jgi:hypothetical protein
VLRSALRPPPVAPPPFLPHTLEVSVVCWVKLVVFAISHTIYLMTDILRRST